MPQSHIPVACAAIVANTGKAGYIRSDRGEIPIHPAKADRSEGEGELISLRDSCRGTSKHFGQKLGNRRREHEKWIRSV